MVEMSLARAAGTVLIGPVGLEIASMCKLYSVILWGAYRVHFALPSVIVHNCGLRQFGKQRTRSTCTNLYYYYYGNDHQISVTHTDSSVDTSSISLLSRGPRSLCDCYYNRCAHLFDSSGNPIHHFDSSIECICLTESCVRLWKHCF